MSAKTWAKEVERMRGEARQQEAERAAETLGRLDALLGEDSPAPAPAEQEQEDNEDNEDNWEE